MRGGPTKSDAKLEGSAITFPKNLSFYLEGNSFALSKYFNF